MAKQTNMMSENVLQDCFIQAQLEILVGNFCNLKTWVRPSPGHSEHLITRLVPKSNHEPGDQAVTQRIF